MGKRHYRVTWADAVRGHEEALRHGGASGIVSGHAIQSTLARPYHGYHRLIHEKAAALVHGVVSNHGFSDGNKRTALYPVELLAQRSGFEFVEDDEVIADTITTVARGETGYEDLAEWFRERLIRPGRRQLVRRTQLDVAAVSEGLLLLRDALRLRVRPHRPMILIVSRRLPGRTDIGLASFERHAGRSTSTMPGSD